MDKQFLGWFSPAKFLYEYLSGALTAGIRGNIDAYLDYTVHYIGKSFSQDIWLRLTGHEKMQSILTMEDTISTRALKAPFEISLLMLEIDGFDEANIFPTYEFALKPGVVPIVHEFDPEDEGSFNSFYDPKLAADSEQLTTEVEAMLINCFKPAYNDVLFDNYPNIRSGTRSAGYTESMLVIEKLPAILRTSHHIQGLVLPAFTLQSEA